MPWGLQAEGCFGGGSVRLSQMVIDANFAVSALRSIADERLRHLIGGYGPRTVIRTPFGIAKMSIE
jgi:hypothetical protein